MALVLSGFVASKTWIKGPEIAWESVEIDGVERVTISAGSRTSHWWLLNQESRVQALVSGPGVARIDSRIVCSDDGSEELPYVLEIKLDGKRLDWFKQVEERSRTWQHPEWIIAKRGCIQLDIPHGSHALEVRLVASDTGRCLIRIGQTSAENDHEGE